MILSGRYLVGPAHLLDVRQQLDDPFGFPLKAARGSPVGISECPARVTGQVVQWPTAVDTDNHFVVCRFFGSVKKLTNIVT